MDAYLEQHGLPVKPGLGRLLGYLRENGYKTALATSTHEEIAGAYLKMAGVEEYFDCKVFGNMVMRGSPIPTYTCAPLSFWGLRRRNVWCWRIPPAESARAGGQAAA